MDIHPRKPLQGSVNEKNHSVTIEVPAGTDKTNLKAAFKVSEGTKLFVGTTEQQSGITANDFSNITDGVKFTLKAEDGTTKDYTVRVYMEKGQIAISTFGFKKADNATLPSDVDNQTATDPNQTVSIGRIPGRRIILMKLPIGTPESLLATLKPDFTVSAGVKLYVGDTELVSGSTEVDFSDKANGVDIKAVAPDGGCVIYNAVVEIDLPKAEQTDVQKYFGSYRGTIPGLGDVIIVLAWDKVTLYSKTMSMDYENVEWEKKADGTYTCTTYKKQKPQIKNLYGKGGYDFTEEGGTITVKTNIMGTNTTATKDAVDFVWTAESGYKPVTMHI